MTPYEQLLARLLPARRFGIVLGLERMHAIFERLGHPQRRLGRVIHVGGTNGKGSTVAMIAQLLQLEAAHASRIGRVAMYTSPHLSCLRERISFLSHRPDEAGMIGEDAIVAAAERVTAAGGDELTFFEQLTAIACVAIAERGVDFTVLEVGLGGRLDATNAIPAEVAVVTGVAMDHAAILGDTLDKIALEKAGIFKPGQRVVIGASGDPAALPVLVEAARKLEARITVVDDAAITEVKAIATSHLGGYQQRNAATALAAVSALDRWVLRQSVMDLQPPPGRFEQVEREGDDVDFILDGAHNPHAAAALAAELRARDLRPTVILAVSSDKDVRGICAALAPNVGHVIATRYQQDRSLPPDELAAVFRGAATTSGAPTTGARTTGAPTTGAPTTGAPTTGAPTTGAPTTGGSGMRQILSAPDLASALALATDPMGLHRDFARTVIQPRPTILITGSLFLVGEARVQLLDAPADPYVVTDPSVTRA